MAEHREIHGLHSILTHGKKGYSRHPETLRWVGCLTGLARRHAQLAAEMRLRGYADRTPMLEDTRRMRWPDVFVTPAGAQYALLRSKYVGRDAGRIPLPRSVSELWAHHKYSVMARGQAEYRAQGKRIARMRRGADPSDVAEELSLILREPPPRGHLVNALEHMWGYVSNIASEEDRRAARASTVGLFLKTRELAFRSKDTYLMASTALSDLAVFV